MGFTSEKRKFILTIGDEGTILVVTDGKNMLKRMFINSPASTEFKDVLAEYPKAPIYILVDVVDQAYIQHTLPPVSSLNIGKLVNRKLAKDFDASDLKAAIPLGREKSGRKDWNFLFVSVRNIPPFSDWVDVISNVPNKFGGIYLLPLEAMNYLKVLQKHYIDKNTQPSGWQIIVSHNRVGGFRQIVFRNNKIVFTRIAQPIGGQTPDVVAGNIEQETVNTIEYIRRLGFEDDEGLDVFIIASQDVKTALEVSTFPSSVPVVLSPHDVAIQLGLETAAEEKDRFGDVVFSVYFATIKRHTLKLQTRYTKKIANLLLVRTLAQGLAACAIAAMIGYTGYSLVEGVEIKKEVESVKKKNTAQEELMAEAEANRVEFDGDPEYIKKIAFIDDKLGKDALLPIDYIRQYAEITQFDMHANHIDLTISKRSNDVNLITADIDVEFRNNGDASIDQILDNLESYTSTVKSKFSDYIVDFSNLPSDNFEVTEDTDTQISIGLDMKGPNYKDNSNQRRGRRRR